MAKVTITIEDKVDGDHVVMMYADHEGWEEGQPATAAILMGVSVVEMVKEICGLDDKEVEKVGGTD